MMSKIKKLKGQYQIIALAIILLVLITVGASYAYLGNNIDPSQVTKIEATVGDMENFIYTPGVNLSLTGNSVGYTGLTNPQATLIAGTNTTTIDSTYNVYFRVISNDFEYTDTVNKPAELLLKVVDPSGTEITTIPGLNYVTSGGVSGFDITEFNTFAAVYEGYAISTDNTTTGITQEWDISVTYVDLTHDQTANNGKTFEADVILKNGKFENNLKTAILANNGGVTQIEAKGEPWLNKASTTQEHFDSLSTADQLYYTVDTGMYAALDDYGTSYYFRGAVDNNWVKFAGYYWRIVRITGDGSIKLMYDGTTNPTEAKKVSGSDDEIINEKFASNISGAEYSGYMYTIDEQHGSNVDSYIKNVIDNWYNFNLKYYDNYLADTIFCNDRTVSYGLGIGFADSGFSSVNRLEGESRTGPTLICPDQRDAYTVDDEINGNGYLTNKVGLITADEVVYAGITVSSSAFFGKGDFNYMYRASLWTMTPNEIEDNWMYNHIVSHGKLARSSVTSANNIVPVVSLVPNTLATGTGTWSDPYIVSGLE